MITDSHAETIYHSCLPIQKHIIPLENTLVAPVGLKNDAWLCATTLVDRKASVAAAAAGRCWWQPALTGHVTAGSGIKGVGDEWRGVSLLPSLDLQVG